MLAAIDATSWSNRRGYGRFARNAVSTLVERDEGSRYVLVCDEATAEREDLPRGAEILTVAVRRPLTETASSDTARPLSDLLRLSRSVGQLRPDVVLFPSLYTWFPVPRTPNVVGVHDTIADQLPELTLPSRGAHLRWRLKRRAAVRQATRIFTVSETSRVLVAAKLGVESARLAVVPEGPDPVFGPRSPEEIAARLPSVGLAADTPYLLYAGGISPHKGLETLLDAFATLARDPAAPRLVLAGALEDEAYVSAAGMVRDRIAEKGIADHVLLPGYVSDETLACLYAGALAFVSPSRAEGFGLPAVEAAISGTAVLLSDIPAHRETLGDAALFFPPGDVEVLVGRLRDIVGNSDLRDRLAATARARVASLTWSAAAEALRAVLVEAARAG